MSIISGEITDVETRLMTNLNFIATEMTNLVQHMEQMENDLQLHKAEHS